MTSMKTLFAYFLWDRERLFYFEICCCAILFLAYQRKSASAIKMRDNVIFPSILIIVAFLNPVMASFLVNRAAGSEAQETRMLRFFWLVPTSLILATATVWAIRAIKSNKGRVLAALAVPLIMVEFAGGFTYLKRVWEPTENWFKMPQAVIELCDTIVNDPTAENTAIFPESAYYLNYWVRQYRPEISMPIAWQTAGQGENYETNKKIEELLQEDTMDLDELARLAEKGNYQYIVLEESAEQAYTGSLEDHGYEEIYRYEYPPDAETFYKHVDAFVLYRAGSEEAGK